MITGKFCYFYLFKYPQNENDDILDTILRITKTDELSLILNKEYVLLDKINFNNDSITKISYDNNRFDVIAYLTYPPYFTKLCAVSILNDLILPYTIFVTGFDLDNFIILYNNLNSDYYLGINNLYLYYFYIENTSKDLTYRIKNMALNDKHTYGYDYSFNRKEGYKIKTNYYDYYYELPDNQRNNLNTMCNLFNICIKLNTENTKRNIVTMFNIKFLSHYDLPEQYQIRKEIINYTFNLINIFNLFVDDEYLLQCVYTAIPPFNKKSNNLIIKNNFRYKTKNIMDYIKYYYINKQNNSFHTKSVNRFTPKSYINIKYIKYMSYLLLINDIPRELIFTYFRYLYKLFT